MSSLWFCLFFYFWVWSSAHHLGGEAGWDSALCRWLLGCLWCLASSYFPQSLLQGHQIDTFWITFLSEKNVQRFNQCIKTIILGLSATKPHLFLLIDNKKCVSVLNKPRLTAWVCTNILWSSFLSMRWSTMPWCLLDGSTWFSLVYNINRLRHIIS